MDSLFAANCALFAHISADSRLYLWDTVGRKQKRSYVDKNHLSHSYTCIKWVANASLENPGMIAIGMSDGVVILWDLSRGVVAKVLGTANDSAVPSDIAFSSDNRTIFVSSSSTAQILQYDVAKGDIVATIKGGKKGTNKIAVNPKLNVIAACSSSIKIVDVASGKKKKLESSFPGGVKVAAFTPCGRFLLAAGGSSREVLVFDVRADAPLSPAFVIPIKGNAVALDTRIGSANNALLHSSSSDAGAHSGNGKSRNGSKSNSMSECIEVLCLLEDSGATVLRLSVLYKQTAASGLNPVLGVCNIQSKAPIIAGAFGKIGYTQTTSSSNTGATANASSVVLALGKKGKPLFKTISFAANDTLLDSVSLDAVDSETAIDDTHDSTSTAEMTSAVPPAVLGPHEMGGKKRPIVEVEVAGGNSSLEGTYAAAVSKKLKSGTGSSGSDLLAAGAGGEQSLEERLAALSKQMTVLEEYAQGKGELAAATVATNNNRSSSAAAAAAAAGTAAAPPTSDSLVTLVDQALQSGDDALLEQCLACTDVEIVEATAQRLSTSRVVLLLRKLLAKFEKRPSRSMLLTQWLSALLRYHTAYLVTIPDLSYQLAGLSQILEQRLSSYMRLSALAGRLDLLMSQVSYSAGTASSTTFGAASGGDGATAGAQSNKFVPNQVFREKDDDREGEESDDDDDEEDEEEGEEEKDDEDEDDDNEDDGSDDNDAADSDDEDEDEDDD